ncbi:MAG: InlB B-repeat-containing protein, partial [Clostridia bacterium]|nr:InlB B-repeat-containing protein [Clostridia bacterium]
TISAGANGAVTGSSASGTYYLGDTLTLVAVPNTGYQFSSWTEDASGTISGASTTYVLTAADGDAGTVTITANFGAITYTVTYDENGGNGLTNDSFNITTSTFSLDTPTRAGYAFGYWKVTTVTSSTVYRASGVYAAQNDTISQIFIGSHGDITVQAQWTYTTATALSALNQVSQNNDNVSGFSQTYYTTITSPDNNLLDPSGIIQLLDSSGNILTESYFVPGYSRVYLTFVPISTSSLDIYARVKAETSIVSATLTTGVFTATEWSSDIDTTWVGSGTSVSPWLISTPQELAGVASQINSVNYATYYDKYYKLTNDINLSGKTWSSIGNYNTINNYFGGNFDGGGYTIFGLTQSVPHTYVQSYTYALEGLFGRTNSDAIIKNLSLENINMNVVRVTGFISIDVGGLVGYAGDATISNIFVSGSIYVNISAGFNAGGIVGCANTSTSISNSSSAVNIKAETTSVLRPYIGGISGYLSNASVANCNNVGTITVICKNIGVGGISGYIYNASVTNCYNTGVITAYSETGADVGGIGGYGYGTGNSFSISNCYNTSDIVSIADLASYIGG